MLSLTNINQKLFFAGFFRGTYWLHQKERMIHACLATSKGKDDSCMSFAGDISSLFLHIPGIAF